MAYVTRSVQGAQLHPPSALGICHSARVRSFSCTRKHASWLQAKHQEEKFTIPGFRSQTQAAIVCASGWAYLLICSTTQNTWQSFLWGSAIPEPVDLEIFRHVRSARLLGVRNSCRNSGN